MKSFIADKNGKLTRLALDNVQGLSYGALMKSLRDKDVKVNGVRVKADMMLNVGDKVDIYFKQTATSKYAVIFRDENLLVINKKRGFTSEEVFDEISQKEETYFIHRLDRNTDGIMVFALNKVAEEELLLGFKNRTFTKIYRATVYGKMPKKSDILTAFLKKDSEKSEVKIFDKEVLGSVMIKTGYQVEKEDEETSVLSVTLYTGKTHQIRAHLAHVGHFIIGDGKYGDDRINKRLGVKEQQLTAYSLTLSFDDKSPLAYLNKKTFTLGGK
ncbi:MAG: RluA family pseudouridine synthase [Clostridiales bacterium]|nr:RluA family pseudouridine synthase [Clostridiales bacterium]